MKILNYRLNFEKLCAKYHLGQITAEPAQVTGGFLHRMYQLKTDKADYAVKALNPQIMQRETAMRNYILSEKVANAAYRNGINALPAIVSNGSCMHKVDGQYYLLFPWVQGKTLPSGGVSAEHCEQIGEILAAIHGTDFSRLIAENHNDNAGASNASPVNWNEYALKGKQQNMEWSGLLSDNLDKLYHWDSLAKSAVAALMNESVISHRDLDPKNVLWGEDQVPIVIDWEAAGPVHPTQELMEVALYWSGETGHASKNAFCTLIRAYRNHGGRIFGNCTDVLNYGFQGKLEWLAYNVRRSLGLECTDDTEQELGTSEVFKTIQALNDYADFIPVGMEWISEMDV